MTIADEEHDLLIEIQDWIFLNADEYKDGQMTDIEIIKDIYARLHKAIDENVEMLEALKAMDKYYCSQMSIDYSYYSGEEQEFHKTVRAAIAKAEVTDDRR